MSNFYIFLYLCIYLIYIYLGKANINLDALLFSFLLPLPGWCCPLLFPG